MSKEGRNEERLGSLEKIFDLNSFSQNTKWRMTAGRLTGSDGRARDSPSRGREFKPPDGLGFYFKKKKKLENCFSLRIYAKGTCEVGLAKGPFAGRGRQHHLCAGTRTGGWTSPGRREVTAARGRREPACDLRRDRGPEGPSG